MVEEKEKKNKKNKNMKMENNEDHIFFIYQFLLLFLALNKKIILYRYKRIGDEEKAMAVAKEKNRMGEKEA